MARIRTIKPEFPQSTSMGRVSRDARLFFILMWTLADDAGRLRGDSRMLARTLYPYDDGEEGHIQTSRSDVEGWLTELEGEGCLVRYEVDGTTFIQIANWLIHQKIDKPSKSKIPPPPESSRSFANTRERSSGDLRIRGSEDQGRDQGSEDRDQSAREPANVPRETNAQHFDGWEFVDKRMRPVYPRGVFRDSHWLNAARMVERLVEAGANPDAIVENAQAYARQQEAMGNTGTQYVLAPSKWLADETWRGPFSLPEAPRRPQQESAMDEINRKLAERARDRAAIDGEVLTQGVLQ